MANASPTDEEIGELAMGALASLLIATIVSDVRMPTLVLNRAGDSDREIECRADRLPVCPT